MKHKFFNANNVQKHLTTDIAVNTMACWFFPKHRYTQL